MTSAREVMRRTFRALDDTTRGQRTYRALVGGRWHIVRAADVTDALREAQAFGEVTDLTELLDTPTT